MEMLDPSIQFKVWNTPNFKNNVITIPADFRYKDIPEFVRIIKSKAKTDSFNLAFENICRDYEERSYFLFKNAQTSKNKDIYIKEASRMYLLSCLYKGIKDPAQIKAWFENLMKENRITNEIDREMKKLVVIEDSRAWISKMKNQDFKLNPVELKSLIIHLENDKSNFIDVFLKKVYDYVDLVNPKDKDVIKEILRIKITTKMKCDEILMLSSIDRVRSLINWVKETFDGDSQKIDIERNIEKSMTKAALLRLKNDFEKWVYYSMIKDINPETKRSLESWVMNWIRIFEKKDLAFRIEYVQYLVMVNYIQNNMKDINNEEFLNLFFSPKRPFPNKKLLSLLPKVHAQNIEIIQKEQISAIENPTFDKRKA